jgi:ribose transport system permease protein
MNVDTGTSVDLGVRSDLRPSLRFLAPGRYAGVILGLIGVCVYLSLTQEVFLTWSNWQNIFRANAIVLILALGMTFVVITAGIDLSVASMTVAAGMVFGIVIQDGWSWLPAVLATVAIGLAMGLTNGVLIGIARISFFVVTLGTLSIYASVALLATFGETITLYDFKPFATSQELANDNVGPIPMVLIVCAVLYAVGAAVLRYTRFGRSVYAVGSNPEAARLSGIRVSFVLVAVYAISGLMAGMAGVVATGRLGAAAPQVDPTLMLTVVAAVLIGGTSYTGGEGGLFGTIIGVFFLGIVQNGLTLGSVSAFWQGTVSGLILIIAVGLGVLREHGVEVRRRVGGAVASRRPDEHRAPADVHASKATSATNALAQESSRIRQQLTRARDRVRALEAELADVEETARRGGA